LLSRSILSTISPALSRIVPKTPALSSIFDCRVVATIVWVRLRNRFTVLPSNQFNTLDRILTSMSEQTPDEAGESDMAELRDEYPSGWRILTQHDSVSYMTDTLLDMPDQHFTKAGLADQAGVSRQSVHTHIDLLVKLDIAERVEGTGTVKYTRSSADEDMIRLLVKLNGLVNQKLNPEV